MFLLWFPRSWTQNNKGKSSQLLNFTTESHSVGIFVSYLDLFTWTQNAWEPLLQAVPTLRESIIVPSANSFLVSWKYSITEPTLILIGHKWTHSPFILKLMWPNVTLISSVWERWPCVSVCLCVRFGGWSCLTRRAKMALSQKHRKLQGGFRGGVLLQMGKDRENKCFQVCVCVCLCVCNHASFLHQLVCTCK